MKTNLRILTLVVATILIGFTSCKKDTYNLGALTSPSDVAITHTIDGKSADNPYGDGTGKVEFNVSAKDAMSYTFNFGDGTPTLINPKLPLTKTFAKIGTFQYTVTVTAIGKAGNTSTAVDTLTVNYAYQVPADILKIITNDSPQGRQWMVDSAAVGNVGLGPIDSYFPDWYNANPNDKAGLGLYQNVYTFTNNGVFVDSTYGEMFGNVNAFAADFNNGVSPPPGKFGGYGDDWTLYQDTYSTKYTFSGDNVPENKTGVIINFEKPGSVGYYLGTQEFQILSITDSTMWLRTPVPAWGQAWYVKLKAKD